MQDEFINEHLVEMCQEMVEYHDTGILPNGRVRELATRLEKYEGIPEYDAQRLSEMIVSRDAIAKCAMSLTLSAAYAGIVTDKEREEFMADGKYPEVVTKGCLQELMTKLMLKAADSGELTGYEVLDAIQELFN